VEQQEQVRVSVRMPVAHAAALEAMAAEEDRTISAEIRRMVRRYIEASNERDADLRLSEGPHDHVIPNARPRPFAGRAEPGALPLIAGRRS
jgi:hypothetical protein